MSACEEAELTVPVVDLIPLYLTLKPHVIPEESRDTVSAFPVDGDKYPQQCTSWSPVWKLSHTHFPIIMGKTAQAPPGTGDAPRH